MFSSVGGGIEPTAAVARSAKRAQSERRASAERAQRVPSPSAVSSQPSPSPSAAGRRRQAGGADEAGGEGLASRRRRERAPSGEQGARETLLNTRTPAAARAGERAVGEATRRRDARTEGGEQRRKSDAERRDGAQRTTEGERDAPNREPKVAPPACRRLPAADGDGDGRRRGRDSLRSFCARPPLALRSLCAPRNGGGGLDAPADAWKHPLITQMLNFHKNYIHITYMLHKKCNFAAERGKHPLFAV